MRDLQASHGNRYVKALMGSVVQAAPVQVVARKKMGRMRRWWEKLKALVGAKPNEEKLIAELNDGLQRAKQICDAGATITTNPEAASRLQRASSAFGKAAGLIGKGLKVKRTVRDIFNFVDAVSAVESASLETDPDGAAKAFGRLFAAAGKLGQKFPKGPWSAYFEFLAGFEDFFVNMQRALDPGKRWKKKFEEIEKEAR